MPASGRHRRQRPSRIFRISLMLTAGGAGVALPLVAASGAAAQPAAATVSAPAAAPASFAESAAQAAAPTAKDAKSAAKTRYTVVGGDTLAQIAETHDVRGGWLHLYDANREVIGDDPNLILPGQKLALKGKSGSAAAPSSAAPKAEKEAPAATPEPAERAERTTERAEPAPEPAPEPAEQAPAAGGFSVPVNASPSTAYRASGALWSSGYHTGVDFSAASGTPVMAVSEGTVVSAGWGGSYGNEVVIRHADGRYSQYAHLSSIGVSNGQSVSAGQQIGLVGSTGNSTGPHLHFEIRTGPGYGTDIDPLAYLRGNGVGI